MQKLLIKANIVFTLFALLIGSIKVLAQEKMEKLKDREPIVAGRFYEGEKEDLNEQVESFLKSSDEVGYLNNIAALIAPHAGYIYSGKVAGQAYGVLNPEDKINTVFVIGSSHRIAFKGASVYNCGNYITPLGSVPVDIEIANELISDSRYFLFRRDAHSQEHSLEVQIPFLQVQLKKPFNIVPIVLGARDPHICKQLANTLKPHFKPGNLFVISSDFSHYPDYATASKVDDRTAKAILTNDPAQLLEALNKCDKVDNPNLLTGLCGWTSVLTLMYLTQDDNQISYKHLAYQNSGDVSFGDRNRVVGYHAIAVIKKDVLSLTREQKEVLLKLAQNELRETVGLDAEHQLDETRFGDELSAPAGAFVSLYKSGKLRGCIGNFSSQNPLWETVKEMTRASASRDNRFVPVSKDELKEIRIEISVLTPLKEVSDISEIVLGRHGIYIKKDGRSGTFLPQVGTKTGWSKEEFLGHCSKDKAGIGWDGWKEAKIYTYEAIVFSEGNI